MSLCETLYHLEFLAHLLELSFLHVISFVENCRLIHQRTFFLHVLQILVFLLGGRQTSSTLSAQEENPKPINYLL